MHHTSCQRRGDRTQHGDRPMPPVSPSHKEPGEPDEGVHEKRHRRPQGQPRSRTSHDHEVPTLRVQITLPDDATGKKNVRPSQDRGAQQETHAFPDPRALRSFCPASVRKR